MPAVVHLLLAGVAFHASPHANVQHTARFVRPVRAVAPETPETEPNPAEMDIEGVVRPVKRMTTNYQATGGTVIVTQTPDGKAIADPFYDLGYHQAITQIETKLKGETLVARAEASEAKREVQTLEAQLLSLIHI